MNYGFVIDNRSCIGCHACSTACKSENEVPLGVYRTWVKYTEAGTYPNNQRHFQVTRCNHCTNPPCARICPTGAMYQRDDGIVEFDSDACIGCKACMQACPYDAIYIDPESHTAAKCHYCAHRLDVGLEPSCAVVCPTHAIIAGDMDDPDTEISKILAREKVSVRKPEQGTAPKVFYIDGAAVNLVPTSTERAPESFQWADVIPLHGDAGASHAHAHPHASSGGLTQIRTSKEGVALRAPQPQGLPTAGPIMMGGKQAAHMVQVGYNAQHKIPWHWPVPAYLVTKGVGTGIFLFLAFLFGLVPSSFDPLVAAIGGAISTFFMLATTALLVIDLEKPQRFLYILMRPQWRSWLARGAIFLMGFSTIAGLWTTVEIAALAGFLDPGVAAAARPYFLWGGVPFAVGGAVYTAFLFGQAEGRDLWQSPLLPIHLLIQAVMAGTAALLVAGLFTDLGAIAVPASWTFLVAVAFDLAVTLLGELGMPHASEVAARAAHSISHGHYKKQFWLGAVVVGHVLPALLVFGAQAALASTWLFAIAGVAAVLGLWFFEHAFVMAPQEVPNS